MAEHDKHIELEIKTTSGHFSHGFDSDATAQDVLDQAIKHFRLHEGGQVSYSLRLERSGQQLALGESLKDLGLQNHDVVIVQTNQAQDG